MNQEYALVPRAVVESEEITWSQKCKIVRKSRRITK